MGAATLMGQQGLQEAWPCHGLGHLELTCDCVLGGEVSRNPDSRTAELCPADTKQQASADRSSDPPESLQVGDTTCSGAARHQPAVLPQRITWPRCQLLVLLPAQPALGAGDRVPEAGSAPRYPATQKPGLPRSHSHSHLRDKQPSPGLRACHGWDPPPVCAVLGLGVTADSPWEVMAAAFSWSMNRMSRCTALSSPVGS